jgi:hypothetical protein
VALSFEILMLKKREAQSNQVRRYGQKANQLTGKNQQSIHGPAEAGRMWTIRGVDERDVVMFVTVTTTV